MDLEFQSRVREWIAEKLQGTNQMSFSDLVCALPGVHPNDIARELNHFGLQPLRNDPKERGDGVYSQDRLPVPHPLDYDWRFTEESRLLLLGEIEQVAPTLEDKVVFLGAPTLFQAARDGAIAARCFLIDVCPETVSALRRNFAGQAFLADILTDELPALAGTVVMADPPWYEEFAQAFLWASSRIVRVGGTILLSAPPVGTRPGIEQEWGRTLAFANTLGLKFIRSDQCLRYESPPFERNALRAAGHPEVASAWRPGVLARFEKVHIVEATRPNVTSGRARWVERSAFGVRFRMRRKSSPAIRNPALIELVDGDVLASVSRRDPRREHADVWTSGNRIFGCVDTEALTRVVEALASGHRADTYVERLVGRKLTLIEQGLVLGAAAQVSCVISRELGEYLLGI